MRTSRRVLRCAFCLLAWAVLAGPLAAAGPDLTFFGWSDQHVSTDGNAQHLLPAIDAMNSLPGKEFPESIGGKVAKPALVFGCGDVTEWPTNAAKNAYDELITKRLKFPAFDLIGNHDEGGKAPVATMLDWVKLRHGSLSYTFERGGVHFVVAFSKYDESLGNPAQPLADEALEFIKTALSKIPRGEPAVVAVHLCFDAMTNRDALVNALGEANVLMVLGGHYHKAKLDEYRGVRFVQLPSPAPKSPSEFTVFRITSDRLVAIPYDYDAKQWDTDPRKVLDVEIKSPSSPRPGR